MTTGFINLDTTCIIIQLFLINRIVRIAYHHKVLGKKNQKRLYQHLSS